MGLFAGAKPGVVVAESLQHGATFGIDVEAHMCRHLQP